MTELNTESVLIEESNKIINNCPTVDWTPIIVFIVVTIILTILNIVYIYYIQQNNTLTPPLGYTICSNILSLICCACLIYCISAGLGNWVGWVYVILLFLVMALSTCLAYTGEANKYSQYIK
jgi:hypothetical protein